MKNKNRRNKFNEIGTPPQPVPTRWGTRLNAAEYYAKNLVKCARLSMHLKVTVFWLATLKLLLMIPTLLNYLPRFTATTKCSPR